MSNQMYNPETYKNIYGLHEIHITVDPGQIALMRVYCKDRKYKPILAAALYGDHPNQLMISKYKNGTTPDVVEKALAIAKDMESFDMTVIRTKVEAMIHNKGCPTGNEKPLHENDYWEFHFNMEINGSDEMDRLTDICKQYNAHISMNVFKREFQPLVTLRIYKKSYDQAMALKAELIENIQAADFVVNDGIHQELSVYDDNPGLDDGWLPGPSE